ncbi:MAG: hypothetical protein CMP81_21035 [Fulvimarina sp.]|nr:hypothetical protein [Fulvimarina sp.]
MSGGQSLDAISTIGGIAGRGEAAGLRRAAIASAVEREDVGGETIGGGMAAAMRLAWTAS